MAIPIGLDAGKEVTKKNLFLALRNLRDTMKESDTPDEALEEYIGVIVDEITELVKTSLVTTAGTAASQTGYLS